MSQPPSPKHHAVLWVVSALLVAAGLAILWLGAAGAPATAPFALPQAEPILAESGPAVGAVPGATAAAQNGTDTEQASPQGSATVSPASAPVTGGLALALADPLPPELLDGVLRWATQHAGTRVVTGTQDADVWISAEASGALLAERIYVPVSRYGDLVDDVTAADLLGAVDVQSRLGPAGHGG